MKVYYAHSISIYGKPQELRDIEALEALGFEVVNPNSEANDWGYRLSGMSWFEEIIEQCDALAFRGHADGSIPAGVLHELRYHQSRGRPFFELPAAIERRALTVEQTRAYLMEVGAR